MKHIKMKKKKGFTLIELLITIGIIAVLAAIIYGSIQVYKNKGKDTQVREALSELQVKLENQEIAPGVFDYQSAFTQVGVSTAINALAAQLGVASGNYDYSASTDEYAIVFPLTTGKYYCVDASRAAKEVSGLLNTTGPKNCDNTTRVPPGGDSEDGAGGGGGGGVSDPAARTLTARGPVSVPVMGPYAKYSFYESLPRGYNDDPNRLWPLLIFMHGQGEQNPPLSSVLRHGVAKEINNGAQLEYTVNGKTDSFVVLIPQSDWWHPYLIDFFIEYAKQNYRIDPTRIYLSGLSVGSAASVYFPAYSTVYAQKIAAIAVSDGIWPSTPVSSLNNPGGSQTSLDYCRIASAHLPVWMFYANGHSPEWTTAIRDIINACNPAPSPALKLTYCTNSTCISKQRAWDEAYLTDHSYQNPNMYEWLLAQHR